jgi:hypothetical protein
MTCPLCGVRIAPKEQAFACERCPLARGCRLSRCPRCGYEWPAESRLVRWMQARWRAITTGASDEHHA